MGSGTSVGVVSHDRGESGLECQHPPTHKDNSFPSLCAYIHTALMIILFPPEGTLKRKMSIAIIKGIIGRG